MIIAQNCPSGTLVVKAETETEVRSQEGRVSAALMNMFVRSAWRRAGNVELGWRGSVYRIKAWSSYTRD